MKVVSSERHTKDMRLFPRGSWFSGFLSNDGDIVTVSVHVYRWCNVYGELVWLRL